MPANGIVGRVNLLELHMSLRVMDLPAAARIAVLGHCHFDAVDRPVSSALRDKLAGADLIVMLGHMGDPAAFDQLEAIAPVVGVQGGDDPTDRRTDHTALLLTGPEVRIGCVYNAKAAGLALSNAPFVEAEGAGETCAQLFGGPVDILLHGTHVAGAAPFLGGRAFNPGSAVIPLEDSKPSFVWLNVTPQGCSGEIVELEATAEATA